MSELNAFRPVPRTGVIYVTTEAQKLGFGKDPSWCNLGQGQPETAALPGAPPRLTSIPVHEDDLEYGPVAGLSELREAIANLYNHLYRQGKKSQYTKDNVAVSGGGRASLTRCAASLGPINLGHFLPDYTAYEELLEIFKAFHPMPISLEAARGYAFSPDDLRREIEGKGLAALLLSNPCNPTGKVIGGAELQKWVEIARELDCTMLLDEFYSHYIWNARPGQLPVESAARYVDDVDKDPVVIFDGLTKNWRYPGFRVTWTLAPKTAIEGWASAGSFLDGGANRPLQRAAIPLLDPGATEAETKAIHATFKAKRDRLLGGLLSLGVEVDHVPDGTFYVWGSVANLPGGLDDGMGFFRAALQQKVIVVPGEFFDVNPGKRRHASSRFKRHVRFSFGPSMQTLDTALERLGAMIKR
ncbi:MAG: pyridoxal phosphate-dependent aminotransferase [Myxococcaceae bacterium]